MLTDKQKMDLENLYNFYSLQKSYDSESRAELIAKMAGLRSAVSILGYKFMGNKTEEGFGVTYTSYTLEGIEKWVAFIYKHKRGRASYS